MAAFTLATDDPVLHDFATHVGDSDPIEIVGARTRSTIGGEVEADIRQVEAPSGVVDHRPEEMLVTVRAGTEVHELHDLLRGAGQSTALPERGGTVGGAVAVAENHLERLGRGSLRDSVLQVRFVTAAGRLVAGGGPVVKNVSGFNVPKLLTGSLGTLGVIAEVVLRTNPIPAVRQWVEVVGADPRSIQQTLLRPGCILWNGTTAWVLLRGHADDVGAERAALGDLPDRPSVVETDGPPSLPEHRWALSPAAALDPHAHGVTGEFVSSVGVGTTWSASPPPARRVDPGAAVVSRRMKDLFDPTGRINPGRHAWT